MATYTEDLTLTVTNNEALDQTITLTQTVAEVTTPFDLTGLTFVASVKKSRSVLADVLAEITVTVVGDPTDGVLRLQIPYATMVTLTAKTRYWDFNIRDGVAEPDCLWIAPFVIEAGVSTWP